MDVLPLLYFVLGKVDFSVIDKLQAVTIQFYLQFSDKPRIFSVIFYKKMRLATFHLAFYPIYPMLYEIRSRNSAAFKVNCIIQ